LVSKLEAQLTQVTPARASRHRNGIEQKRFAFAQDSTAPQLAVKQPSQPPALPAKLRHDDSTRDRPSPMNGVLSALPVEVGAQCSPATVYRACRRSHQVEGRDPRRRDAGQGHCHRAAG